MARQIKAQSFMDYAVLIAVVALSLIAMSSYVLRAIDAKVEHTRLDLIDPVTGIR